MTLFEPTATTAAVAACVSVALVAGHWLGDHPVQSDADAAGKGRPDDAQLAVGVPVSTGWRACLRHVAGYVGCQAITLALVAFVAPLTFYGAIAALAISGSTHAVIDRRWIVRAIIRAKGCHGWADGPYLIDQSLHYTAMFVAAIAAALVTTAAGLLATVMLADVIVCVCLVIEHEAARHATAVTSVPAELTMVEVGDK